MPRTASEIADRLHRMPAFEGMVDELLARMEPGALRAAGGESWLRPKVRATLLVTLSRKLAEDEAEFERRWIEGSGGPEPMGLIRHERCAP